MNALIMTPDKLNDFCDFLLAQGRRSETVSAYRRKLRTLYTFLPEDKALTEQSVQRYIAWLREKYESPQTINTYISSMNSFLQHYGCRGLCAPHVARTPESPPELSREEYHRLLQVAKLYEDERLYLLVKSFATIGVTVQDLPKLTVQAAREGCLRDGASEGTLLIPDCLRQELLEYSARRHIKEGAIFLDGSGLPLQRAIINRAMKRLCADARVAEEKVNPRCLRKLCLATKEAIYSELLLLADRGYERFLEQEQPVYGWEQKEIRQGRYL